MPMYEKMYHPPGCKPRLFTPLGWVAVVLGCCAVLAIGIFGSWVLDALYHGPR